MSAKVREYLVSMTPAIQSLEFPSSFSVMYPNADTKEFRLKSHSLIDLVNQVRVTAMDHFSDTWVDVSVQIMPRGERKPPGFDKAKWSVHRLKVGNPVALSTAETHRVNTDNSERWHAQVLAERERSQAS